MIGLPNIGEIQRQVDEQVGGFHEKIDGMRDELVMIRGLLERLLEVESEKVAL